MILMVGLPRSGKSTIAMKSGHPVVNPDSIRLALHGGVYAPKAERAVWTIAHYMVESLFLAGHDHVVLDATNTTVKRRREWVSEDWDLKFAWVDTPVNVCLGRANHGGREELVPVIHRMNASFERDGLFEADKVV